MKPEKLNLLTDIYKTVLSLRLRKVMIENINFSFVIEIMKYGTSHPSSINMFFGPSEALQMAGRLSTLPAPEGFEPRTFKMAYPVINN